MYKIFLATEAASLMTSGQFGGSEDDIRDGFIHLSTAEQVNGTLLRHFRDKPMLFLGIFAADKLGTDLRMEPSRGGDLFPHLYRPLFVSDLSAIVPVPDVREGWSVPTLASAL